MTDQQVLHVLAGMLPHRSVSCLEVATPAPAFPHDSHEGFPAAPPHRAARALSTLKALTLRSSARSRLRLRLRGAPSSRSLCRRSFSLSRSEFFAVSRSAVFAASRSRLRCRSRSPCSRLLWRSTSRPSRSRLQQKESLTNKQQR